VNVILKDCHERIFSLHTGVEKDELGLQLIRGDNIALVGGIDVDEDDAVDLETLRAEPLPLIIH
jgi:U6 snRNA-associated Sm-like protein LSm8